MYKRQAVHAEAKANRAALRKFVEDYARDNLDGGLPSTCDEWAAVHAALKEGGSPLAELWTAGTLNTMYSKAAGERPPGDVFTPAATGTRVWAPEELKELAELVAEHDAEAWQRRIGTRIQHFKAQIALGMW